MIALFMLGRLGATVCASPSQRTPRYTSVREGLSWDFVQFIVNPSLCRSVVGEGGVCCERFWGSAPQDSVVYIHRRWNSLGMEVLERLCDYFGEYDGAQVQPEWHGLKEKELVV